MRVSDFDFDLPEALIALRPARPRRAARLLVAEGPAGAPRGNDADRRAAGDGGPARLTDCLVSDLASLLRPGDLLALNDTRVIPARLRGARRRDTSDGSGVARIEATLAVREGPAEWRALVRPARRLAVGDVISFAPGIDDAGAAGIDDAGADGRDGAAARELLAEVAALQGGEALLRFALSGAALDAAVAAVGSPPLPPYIESRRAADARDREDYQTVFARADGSVAAPTAALHFDAELLDALAKRGVLTAHVTLHVGAGTFLPVRGEAVDAHRMHAEWGEITPEAAAAINAARAAGGRIIAVGTTALRLLESAAEGDGRLAPWRGETDIFITPGYRFRAIDGLMTNFHLPRSTLFMLVCALMGTERMRAVYAHAIARGYRFYSYGDSSLLLPTG